MGAPSGPSVSRPVALMSPPPGACAVVEPRAVHVPPDGEISNSSLPTTCPSSVMRNFPLSGTSPVVGTAAFVSLFFCRERCASGAAATAAIPDAKQITIPSATRLRMVLRSWLTATDAPARPRPPGCARTGQRYREPEFARQREWIPRCSQYDNPPAGNMAGALRTVYENWLRPGREACLPSVHTVATGYRLRNRATQRRHQDAPRNQHRGLKRRSGAVQTCRPRAR